jgi:glycerol-3-phosphate dehydrogenase (NAD(P)+)
VETRPLSAAPKRIGVLGAGSWGTALALHLGRNGHAVDLWGRDPGSMREMARTRSNERYLSGHVFADSVKPTADLKTALRDIDLLVLVVPSHAFRETLEISVKQTTAPFEIVWGTKGFDPGSGSLLHEVAGELLPRGSKMAVLSGPTFAAEIAAGFPAAVTVASQHEHFAAQVAGVFHSPRFRVYTSEDVIGVQAAGAVKNVLAVAAGIADGLGFGANTRAALVTRGLAELVRLGTAFGGRQETFMGLAGLGDLVLSCTDDQSRNRRFGLALARGMSVDAAVASVGQVVEGAETTRQVARAGKRLGVELPIVEQVYRVIYDGRPPLEAVNALLGRPRGSEGV